MGRHGIILLCIPYMEIQGGKSFLNFGIHGGGGGYEKHTFTNMIEREGNIYSQ